MHLGGIALHCGATAPQVTCDAHSPWKAAGELIERFSDYRFYVHRDAFRDSTPTEREDAIDQRPSALAGGSYRVEIAAQ